MKIYYLFVSLLIVPAYLFSQTPRLNHDCQFANEIVIEESGIHAVSKNNSDTITTDVKSNTVLYSYADQTKSFWYKIVANDNCEIAFNIYPDIKGNTFNYFLYKIPADISVSEIEVEDIAPVRANMYKKDMFKSGTGLSLSSAVSYNNPNSKDRIKDFYYTPYHSAIPAKIGEVYMLNIYHVEGTDGGYRFTLKNEKHSQKFQAIAHSFYSKQLAKAKVERSLNPKIIPAVIPKTEIAEANHSLAQVAGKDVLLQSPIQGVAKATYVTLDSIKHTVIPAEITWTKQPMNSNAEEKKKGDILLEKNTKYKIAFSALGYKNKLVSFSTQDDLNSFSQDVVLSPVMEGEDFVMDKIYFYPNTYAIKSGGLSELDMLVSYLNANPLIKVEIQGHTSGNKRIKASRDDKYEEGSFIGSAKKLSQFRAETIKKYLMQKGIAGERLIAIGYGGSEMIYRHPKNQAEANKNIRVAILILPQKENALTSRASK